MKIFVLLLLSMVSNLGYAKLNKKIILMQPQDRYNLFLSTKEVADAYSENGRNSKAQAFYKSALDIYPIGDLAHQLANKLGLQLDDDATYSNFIQMGDQAVSNSNDRVALSYYLMANELFISVELYQKIANVYDKMGDKDNSIFYDNLANQESQIEDEIVQEVELIEESQNIDDMVEVETEDMIDESESSEEFDQLVTQ